MSLVSPPKPINETSFPAAGNTCDAVACPTPQSVKTPRAALFVVARRTVLFDASGQAETVSTPCECIVTMIEPIGCFRRRGGVGVGPPGELCHAAPAQVGRLVGVVPAQLVGLVFSRPGVSGGRQSGLRMGVRAKAIRRNAHTFAQARTPGSLVYPKQSSKHARRQDMRGVELNYLDEDDGPRHDARSWQSPSM